MGPATSLSYQGEFALSPLTPGGAQHAQRMRWALMQSVALVFEIDERQLATATRGKAPIARARQVAMYMAHIACCMTLTDVGRLFGRDRTTVAHACEAIEDLRDDPAFDRRLDLLEQAVLSLMANADKPTRLAS